MKRKSLLLSCLPISKSYIFLGALWYVENPPFCSVPLTKILLMCQEEKEKQSSFNRVWLETGYPSRLTLRQRFREKQESLGALLYLTLKYNPYVLVKIPNAADGKFAIVGTQESHWIRWDGFQYCRRIEFVPGDGDRGVTGIKSRWPIYWFSLW